VSIPLVFTVQRASPLCLELYHCHKFDTVEVFPQRLHYQWDITMAVAYVTDRADPKPHYKMIKSKVVMSIFYTEMALADQKPGQVTGKRANITFSNNH